MVSVTVFGLLALLMACKIRVRTLYKNLKTICGMRKVPPVYHHQTPLIGKRKNSHDL